MLELFAANSSDFFIILGCLVASAFFSASETAITSLGVMKSRHLLEQDPKTYRSLKLWLKYPGRVLTTILIFNNIVNILASAEATVLATRYFQNQAVGIATGVITVLVLVFGEVMPKSFARLHALRLAPFALSVINVLYQLTRPIVILLSGSANYLIKKFGTAASGNFPAITEEEIEFLVKEGEKAGIFEDTKKSMISGVFDFDETKVREIMTPRPDIVSLEKKATLDEAMKVIIETGHSRIPIYEEKIDQMVGVLFAKDILRSLDRHKNAELAAGQVMRKPLFEPESKPIVEVFKDLKKEKSHMAIIIDEYGGTAGIVTMEDILEEIVGDIQDEFDREEAKIRKLKTGVFEVVGSVNFSDFVEYFEIEQTLDTDDEGDADTIGGWMTHQLGDLPEVGQSIILQNLSLEVATVGRHRIERLHVTVGEKDEAGKSQPSEDSAALEA